MKEYRLKNGLTVLLDNIEHAKTVTISYFVNVGSYDETGYPYGISHFIEHMLFKGTKNRTAHDINEEIDAVGGILNAYTDYEKTRYYCIVPYDQWKVGLDVLSDLIWNHTLLENEIEREKTVVLEEIKMYRDNPKYLAMDLLQEEMHKNYPVRYSIIGTPDSVKSITREDMINYINQFYQPNNIVLVITGKINEDEILDFINNYEITRNGKTVKEKRDFYPEPLKFETKTIQKEIEQSHLVWGLFGPSVKDDDSYVMDVIVNILGGGMSSRLYKIIREEKGLAYTVSVYNQCLSDSGIVMGYVGLDGNKLNEVKDIIVEEFEKIAKDDVSENELKKSIQNVIGVKMIELEQPSSLNDYQGSSYLLGISTNLDEDIKKYRNVTIEDVKRVAQKYFTPDNWQFIEVLPKKIV